MTWGEESRREVRACTATRRCSVIPSPRFLMCRATYWSLVVILSFCAAVRAQDIRITEFLAVNTTGLKDEDGIVQPWIELWNPDRTNKYSLLAWQLTSQPSGGPVTTWIFPNIEILPNEHLIIFASGNNRTAPTAQLHTNFTIPAAAGSTLTLKRPGGTTTSSVFASYPVQTADVSYGRDAVEPNLVGFYTNPTPEESNNFSGTGVAGKLLFDAASTSRAFTGTINVTLSQATPEAGAVIRYTTNGTVPTSASTEYTAPIAVTGTVEVRARVFAPGKLPGEAESECYLLLDSSTTGFTSPLPIVALTNFGLGTPTDGDPPNPIDNRGFIWIWEPAGPEVPPVSRMTNPPVVYSRVGMDRRGSSTLGNAKYNLNIEAHKDHNEEDKDIQVLGMPSDSEWILHAPFDFDRALCRNPFVYSLSRSINRYAPRHRMAEVFIDINAGSVTFVAGSQSGDYFGVYNVLEKIRRSNDRVNIKKLGTYDNDTVGKTGGYIVKVDRRDVGDTGFATANQPSVTQGSITLGLCYSNPREIEILTPQRDPQETYIKAFFNDFDTALHTLPYNDLVNGYRKYLDVSAAIDHHLMNTWSGNLDALRLSGYLHKERGGKITYGPMWDVDRSMDSNDNRDDGLAPGNMWSSWRSQQSDFGTNFFNYAWWNKLFNDIDFYQAYIDRWVQLRRAEFSQATIEALFDQLHLQLGPFTGTGNSAPIQRDKSRWAKSARNWTSLYARQVFGVNYNAGTAFTGQFAEMVRMKDWLQKRAEFMDSQWVGPVVFNVAGGNVPVGTQVFMSGPAGATIYYTIDGIDPRPSGGGAPTGGGVLSYEGSPVTITSTTRIRARAYHPGWSALTGTNNPPLVSKWSGLTDVRYATDTLAAAGNIRVTEIQYHPSNPTSAELAVNPVFGENDFQFIEIKNVGGVPVDLGGTRFTDGITFTFSGDNAITLAPGAHAIIAENLEAFIARYGSKPNLLGPFADDLSNGGEQVVLTSSGGAAILDFTYDDVWYPATDGDGFSLVVYNPNAAATAFSASTNWRQSIANGGSPGTSGMTSINAGPDINGLVTGVNLAGSFTDDRLLTPSPLAWSKQSGPGTANFGSASSLDTTATFSQPGVYVLRLTANDGITSIFDELTVTAKDTLAAWQARYPGIGAFDDDFDGDGMTNYEEFAYILDPTIPDSGSAAAPIVGTEAGRLTITYRRHKPPSSVTYSVEVTSNVASWPVPGPGDVTETILSDNGVTQLVKATDATLMSSVGSRFIRVKVTPAP